MLNDTLFSELVEASRDLPGNRWAVGGNAPVMASRMATEGCDILLGGSFSPDFTDVLSPHITGTRPKDTYCYTHLRLLGPSCLLRSHAACTNPTIFLVAGNIIEEPDIHLILEYPSGASWGQYTSRRANRYVLV